MGVKGLVRIGVNTRLLLPHRLEGIGRVSHEILKRLVRSHPEVEFYFFFDRKPADEFVYGANVKPIVVFPQARHPILYWIWFEHQIPSYVRKYGIQLFFSPDAYLSTRLNIPQVPIFHDLAFEHFPETIPLFERWFHRYYFPRYARIAKKMIAVSEATREDLVRTYGVDRDRITVIHNGYDPALFRPVPEEEKRKARERYAGGSPYFLSVATIQPRKNLNRLLIAFDRFRDEVREPVKLVLVGRKGWKVKQALAYYERMKYRDDVLFTGYVEAENLPSLYAGSIALCYVSVYEGFGLPILEALACHSQVVFSNVSSMPEVAGPFGIPVNPLDVDAIVEGLRRAYLEPLQLDLSALESHLWRFSWDEAAKSYWQVLHSAFRDA
jgi:glycosyltransferase involved in cell wall biosynthesis